MRITKRLLQTHFVQAALLASVAAVFITLLLPVQTLLANGSMFSFGVGDVAIAALPWTIVASIIFFVFLVGVELFAGRLLYVLLAAFLVCEYLETGIFSIGLPSLDGDLRAMYNPFRMIINTSLWIVFGGGILLLYHWIKDYTHFIALGVFVMAGASLFDVGSKESQSHEQELFCGFCPHYDVVKSVRFSPDRNVIVLILDTFRASMAAEALRREPALKAHFTGFVAYENNLAMHENTYRALPGLMTGIFLSPTNSASDYAISIHGPDSFIMPYVKKDCPVYFSNQLLSYAYTNRRRGDFSHMTSELVADGPVFFRNSTGIPYVTLFDIVKFRLLPYAFKRASIAAAFAHAVRGGNGHGKEVYSERLLYPMILSEPLSSEKKTSLVVLHTSGPHGPICSDRNGKSLSKPSQKFDDYNEYSVFVLRQVAAFLDGLRQKGIYDKSYVIIAADHGLIDVEGLAHMKKTGTLMPHGADSSILWIKPYSVSTPMTSRTIPTSNCKVATLVRTLAERDLTQEEAAAILQTDDRHFYAKYGSTWYSFGRYLFFYEWCYDANGKVLSCTDRGVWNAN